MPKLTAKRQVTLPQAICEKLELQPGDTVQVFERDGVAHLVKMTEEPLAGILKTNHPIEASLNSEALKSAVKDKAARKHQSQS